MSKKKETLNTKYKRIKKLLKEERVAIGKHRDKLRDLEYELTDLSLMLLEKRK